MNDKREISKEDEKLFIAIMAHFYKEIPLAIKKGVKLIDLTKDERANAEIEMFEDLKNKGRLTHPH